MSPHSLYPGENSETPWIWVFQLPQDCPKSCITHVRICDTPNNSFSRLFITISSCIRDKLLKALRIKGFQRIATALFHCSGLDSLKDFLQAIASQSPCR